MSEHAAREWIADRYGEAATAQVDTFLTMVVAENANQNLIAPSTVATIWQRHGLDSAQLLAFDRPGETWLDVGTGGGFPGMILAILRAAPVVMVEPRARRATFLRTSADALGLNNARVFTGKVERWSEPAGVISARAVSSIGALFESARQCAGAETRWVLPKGRSAAADIHEARTSWHAMFHVEQSLVEPDAGIVIAERVRRR